MKRKTIESVIEEFKKVHDDLYDYSLVEYKNTNTKVKIICKIHGTFEQIPKYHIKRNGCPNCKSLSKEEFIEKSCAVHGDRYDYARVEYKNNYTPIIIICSEHGEFTQTPGNHMRGAGCLICGGGSVLTKEEFIKKAMKVHGDTFDYSRIEYKNYYTKINIICKKHGIFEQKPRYHLDGRGCLKCSYSDLESFILKSNEIHINKYDYSIVDYNGVDRKVIIKCPVHGNFSQLPQNHMKGQGCPSCKDSQGEKVIRKFLIENNIVFESQKKFDECKYKRKLPFDFYLPQHNICIEFDGEQHFEIIKVFGGEKRFKKIQICDNIKTKYCIDENIRLIRIRKETIDNLVDLILNVL